MYNTYLCRLCVACTRSDPIGIGIGTFIVYTNYACTPHVFWETVAETYERQRTYVRRIKILIIFVFSNEMPLRNNHPIFRAITSVNSSLVLLRCPSLLILDVFVDPSANKPLAQPNLTERWYLCIHILLSRNIDRRNNEVWIPRAHIVLRDIERK